MSDSLAYFRDWLVQEGGHKRTTTSTYVSNVNRMLRAAPDLTVEQFDAFFAGLSPRSRPIYTTAWRRFQEFGRTRGVDVPPALPSEVASAVHPSNTAGFQPAPGYAVCVTRASYRRPP